MADLLDELAQNTTEQDTSPPEADPETLVGWVNQCVTAARAERDRLGVMESILLGDAHGAGKYTPDELARLRESFGDNAPDIFYPLTATKAQALQNWLADIFRPAVDKPFTLMPTPVPSLPAYLEDAATEQVAMMVEQGDVPPEKLDEAVQQARQVALDFAKEQAREAARRAEDRIHDMLVEGGWRDVFDQFVVDISRYPAAVINGPVIEKVRRVRWDGDTAVEREETVMRWRRVDPRRWFPAPGADTVQSAEWVMEIRALTRAELYRAMSLPGFRPEEIESLLEEREWYRDASALTYDSTNFVMSDEDAAHTYDVRVLVGMVPRRLLGMGEDGYVFAEVWACDRWVLRVVTDPWPGRRKPYFVAGFRRIPGSVWFQSLPDVLRDVQRSANAAARALTFNVGLSAGPIAEVNVDALANEEAPDLITPMRVYKTTSNPLSPNTPAIRLTPIPSVTSHLLAALREWDVKADDASGIPAYVAGDPNVAGAGRTLGGLAMLMGNAAKGIKRVVGTVDNLVIQPMVELVYEIMLLYDTDTSVKADAQIVARGASGLLQRELTQARAMDLLQLILNPAIVQTGVVPPEAVPNLLREVAASLGYDPDLVAKNPQAQAALIGALQRVGLQVQGAPDAMPDIGAARPSPGPQALDGRSQPDIAVPEAQAMATEGMNAAV